MCLVDHTTSIGIHLSGARDIIQAIQALDRDSGRPADTRRCIALPYVAPLLPYVARLLVVIVRHAGGRDRRTRGTAVLVAPR